MKNSLDCKKLLSYGKELSIFAGILLVLLFVFSCNNILMRNSGSLVITVPGARAATASRFTIELTGTSGFNKSETLAGGTTVQFDDLAPDTYSIVVEGMDTNNKVVLGGASSATVVAGETVTVPVKLQNLLGSLTVDFVGAESDSVVEYIVTLSGPNEFKETEKVDARTVQFEGLIPGDYTVSVEGKNGDDVVLAGTSSKIPVEAGKNAPAKVNLENKLGSLTVNFSGASVSTGTTLTVRLTDSGGVFFEKPSSGEAVQFDNLVPGTYDIVVEGKDASNVVVLGGIYNATVTAGEAAPAKVELKEVVSDLQSLKNAMATSGTVYVWKSIDIEETLSISTDVSVTILPAYQDVTLKNDSSGNLFKVTSGNLTIGGGEYTITLDGNQVAQSIISVSGGTATLASNGIITNAASAGVSISYGTGAFVMTGGTITDNVGNNGGGVTMGGGTFSMTGGSITGNDGNYNGGGVFMGSGTFSMTGGSITGNSAGTSGGGGVAISGGTFMISGGSITGNSAEAKGNGVCMTAGAFKISGNAVIASNNDVYLDSGRRITVSGEITAEDEFIATITPSSYSTGTLVMSAENGVALEDIVSKFAVTPNGTESWKIATDGTLMKDEGL